MIFPKQRLFFGFASKHKHYSHKIYLLQNCLNKLIKKIITKKKNKYRYYEEEQELIGILSSKGDIPFE
jgi:hypothetical protein